MWPVEIFFARLWKGMFARQFIIIAEKRPEESTAGL
jgi:hypothetical protein